MNTVVIVQARLTSTRLPGKVLKLIGPSPAIVHTIVRAQETGLTVLLAVPQDQLIEFWGSLWPAPQLCPTTNLPEPKTWPLAPIPVTGGPENDVLGRMAGAAMEYHADIVVRLTGDCPFVDPRMVWACAHEAAAGNCYVANCGLERPAFARTEPKGLDVEAFPTWMLVDADLYATEDFQREHVTPWIRSTQECRALRPVTCRPDLRWVLDTQEDYDWFCKLATMLDCTPPHPTTRELLTFLKDHPEMERRDD